MLISLIIFVIWLMIDKGLMLKGSYGKGAKPLVVHLVGGAEPILNVYFLNKANRELIFSKHKWLSKIDTNWRFSKIIMSCIWFSSRGDRSAQNGLYNNFIKKEIVEGRSFHFFKNGTKNLGKPKAYFREITAFVFCKILS